MRLKFSPPEGLEGKEIRYYPPPLNMKKFTLKHSDPIQHLYDDFAERKLTFVSPFVEMGVVGEGAWAVREVPAGQNHQQQAHNQGHHEEQCQEGSG